MPYNDTHLRKQLTKQSSALLAEYERCTKRTVHLDYMRLAAIQALAIRDITVDDIFNVVKYVKKRIRAGDNKKGIGMFREASLEFMNLLGDAGKFCDRLHTAREELINYKGRKQPALAVIETKEGNDTVSRIDAAPLRAPQEARGVLSDFFKGLARQIEAA